MKNIIDLHIHSNFSEDADHSMDEIFRASIEASISVISVTDHDSIESIKTAADIANGYQLEYIPGVEITTVFPLDGSQQHILGYFIDEKNPGLLNILRNILKFRDEVAYQRIDALRKIGFHLDEENIKRMAGNRPVSAVSIMIELFNNKNNSGDQRLYPYIHGDKKEKKIMNFYRDFLIEDKPAYVPFKSISTEEGINTIIQAGGIPILAHPVFVKNNEWLDNIKEMGIKGLEAVSSYHNEEEINFYIKYAKKNNLLITAGSDFHGPTSKPHIKLGAHKNMHYSYYEQLKEMAGK